MSAVLRLAPLTSVRVISPSKHRRRTRSQVAIALRMAASCSSVALGWAWTATGAWPAPRRPEREAFCGPWASTPFCVVRPVVERAPRSPGPLRRDVTLGGGWAFLLASRDASGQREGGLTTPRGHGDAGGVDGTRRARASVLGMSGGPRPVPFGFPGWR